MALDFKDFSRLKWYKQVLIVAFVCGGILGLVWYQVLAPMEVEIEAKQAELTKLEGEIAKAKAQLAVYARFKAEAQALEKQLAILKKVLPLEKETDSLLRALQDTTQASGLRILRFLPRPQADRDVYLEWPIDMEIVGTYHNIGSYLDKIRKLDRIVNISNLKITSRASSGDAASTASVGATYVATTFIYREEGPGAVPAASKPAR
jgi:type IV pilus assembly protein PilO